MNIVFLQYAAGNSCPTRVVDQQPANVTVLREKGVWSWETRRAGGSHKIGRSRHLFDLQDGAVIGVYDRDDTQHLSTMLRVAIRVASEYPVADKHPINPGFYEGPYGGG
jgi:hypothetical protein